MRNYDPACRARQVAFSADGGHDTFDPELFWGPGMDSGGRHA